MTTMTNEYIDQAIVDDCHNDMNITQTIRAEIQGAMAYNDEFLTDVIAKLDDILAEVVAPLDNKIEEGINYHEQNRWQ